MAGNWCGDFMINFLALAESSYENTARGILYVIYEILWKFMYYILILIDEITKLFYKVAGINVSNGEVKNTNMFDQLLNQSVIGTWYGIFIAIAAALVIIFTLVAIIRGMASNEEKKSIGPILKNVGLATLILVVFAPLALFLISLISNFGILVASMGGDTNISIADIIFGNSGNLVTIYNEKYLTEFTSFRELGNDFLYELLYHPSTEEGATSVAFHWYIVILGGGFVLYNLACMVIDLVKRVFNILILYVGAPFAISKMVMDDGRSFREWQSRFFKEFVLFLTQMGTFMIFIALVNVLANIDFESLATSTETPEDNPLIGGGIIEGEEEEIVKPVETFSLLNGLGRTLIIMAAVSVTRSSANMLTELLMSKESKTENLLDVLITKVSSRNGQPRTRTITRNTTTTKRETVFVERGEATPTIGSHSNAGTSSNTTRKDVINNTTNHITQNVSVNNKFNSTNNISNRVVKDGIAKGGYGDNKPSPSNIYINATKTVETTPTKDSFKFMDNVTPRGATTVIKEYTQASNNLNNAISSNDRVKLNDSLKEYTRAYSKEAELLSKNYQTFEARASTSMKSEVSTQTKQELRNITSAYRKAQMDYSKTASKLKEYDGERISTSDALKMKEQADKQRERLMAASNKAAQFYENQKKGE